MAVSNRAKELKAAGEDVISYGAGEPDFATPDHVLEAAHAAIGDPLNHRYSANVGLAELREAVVAATQRFSGVDVAPDRVLITNGAKQAVFQTLAALVGPPDEVLIPAPYWVTYPEAVSLTGAIPVTVPTDATGGYKITPAQLDEHTTDATKLLLFVSPSNPTGVVYTADETAAIRHWAGERGIWVLTDEIYQHLVYGDAGFTSIVGPELEDRWVIVNGVSKSHAMTGWRVGWMTGPADVISAAASMQSHLTSNVNNIAQRAAIAALNGPWDSVEEMRLAFDNRRRTMMSMLAEIPGVAFTEPHGAFYVFADLSAHLGDRFDTTLDLTGWILDEAGIALVPGEAFAAPGHARFSYALGDDDLIRGLERLANLLQTAPV